MIESFHIKNFLSISETEIRMTYEEGRAPAGYKERSDWTFFEPQGTKSRVVPCLALYGPNASGKTNIIRAFACLCDIVRGNEITYSPNKLIKSNKDATEFSIVFYVNRKKASYSVSFNKTILSERLEYDGQELFSVKNGKILSEALSMLIEYTRERLEKILEVECTKDGKQYRSFFNSLAKDYSGLNKGLRDVFSFFKHIGVFPNNNLLFSYGMNLLCQVDDEKFIDQLEEVLQEIAEILQKLDIDIKKIFLKDYDFSQMQLNDTPIRNGNFFIRLFSKLRSYHVSDSGEMVEFNFWKEESEGTQTAAGVVSVCLAAMQYGGVLIMDEMDRSIHPLVFAEIVRLLKDKEYNKNQAQVIFTTHCTELLDSEILGQSEVCIINKTKAQGTVTNRISDYNGVKKFIQLRQKYLDGFFSGIPFPYI